MNDHVSRAREVIRFDLDVVLLYGLEIASARQACQAGFQRAVVQTIALSQRNAAPEVAVWKTAHSPKFQMPQGIGWRRAELQFDAHRMRHRIGESQGLDVLEL